MQLLLAPRKTRDFYLKLKFAYFCCVCFRFGARRFVKLGVSASDIYG